MAEINENLTDLYRKSFPVVAGYIRKNGGDYDTAKDLFQDAFVIYLEKKDRDLIASPVSYITGTAKHLWLKKIKESKSDLDEDVLDAEQYDTLPDTDRFLSILERQGKKCLDLLSAFYYENMNMAQIAKKFSFSGERSATVQKYKCIEKMRQYIKTHSISKEYFYE